jgi:hypothetical protein
MQTVVESEMVTGTINNISKSVWVSNSTCVPIKIVQRAGGPKMVTGTTSKDSSKSEWV